MIIEIMSARGVNLWIDGERAERNWYIYGGDEGSCKVSQSYGEATPVEIGPHKITEIRVDMDRDRSGAYHLFDAEGHPAEITLTTTDGAYTLPVVSVLTGCSLDEDGEIKYDFPEVVLANGETKVVDEITLYVKAEGDIQPDQS